MTSAASRVPSQVVELVQACRIHRRGGGASVYWLGERAVRLPLPNPADPVARASIVAAVQGVLYRCGYTSGRPVALRLGQPTAVFKAVKLPFIGELSAALSGRQTWEPGWRFARFGPGMSILEQNKLRVRVESARCRTHDGMSPVLGDDVLALRSREYRGRSPGFYAFVGNAPEQAFDEVSPLVRFYWHLLPSSATEFVRRVSSRLGDAGVPFWAKVLDDPSAYVRCDAGVLYVPENRAAEVVPFVLDLQARLQPYMRPSTPMFTLRLRDGLGFAEDPPGRDSFGMARCNLVAEALVRRLLEGGHGRAAESVAQEFERGNINLLSPHLRSASSAEPAWLAAVLGSDGSP